MKYLLDTEVLILIVNESDKLTTKSLQIINNPKNTLLISAASYHEMAIKISKGFILLPISFEELVARIAKEKQSQILPIKPSHSVQLSKMPYENDHKDPFDRIIIASAIVEKIPVIASDSKFRRYPIQIIW